MKRYFKSYNINSNDTQGHGRYCAEIPHQAAKKCAAKCFQKNKYLGINTSSIDICIRECTQGSRKKMYFYHATKINLLDPIEVHIGNKIITYHHKIFVKPIANPNIGPKKFNKKHNN